VFAHKDFVGKYSFKIACMSSGTWGTTYFLSNAGFLIQKHGALNRMSNQHKRIVTFSPTEKTS